MIAVKPYEEHEKEGVNSIYKPNKRKKETGLSLEESKIIFSAAEHLKRNILAYLVGMPRFISMLAGYEENLRHNLMTPSSIIAGKSPKNEEKGGNKREAIALLQGVRELGERHTGKWLYARRTIVLYSSNLKMSAYAGFVIDLSNRLNHANRLDKSSKEYKEQMASLTKETGLKSNQLHEALKEINKNWQLFHEKELYIAQKYKSLCEYITMKHQSRGVYKKDLMQEAKFGIMNAFERYDHRRGIKFSTYVYDWIRQAVGSAVVNQWRHVRVPLGVYERMNKISRAGQEIFMYTRKRATVEQVAQYMNVPVEDIKSIMMIMHQKFLSLDELLIPDDPESASRGDLIADQKAIPPPVHTEDEALRQTLEESLKKLGPLNELIVKMRHGLYDGTEWKYREIGKELGMTKQAVSQRDKASLIKLGKPTLGNKLRSFTNNNHAS